MGKFANKTAFEILNVDENTTEEELKIQYSKLVKEYKPNLYPEEFQEINQAYKFLVKRSKNKSQSPSNPIRTGADVKSSKRKEVSVTVPLFNHQDFSEEAKSSISQRLVINDEDYNYPKELHRRILMNEDIYPELFQKSFVTPYDPFTEVITFYMVAQKVISTGRMIELFEAHCSSDIVDIFKAFLSSKGVKQPSVKYLDLFTDLEQRYFNSTGQEEVELFDEIIKTSGFSYPFNYLSQFSVSRLCKNKPESFTTYVNSLNGKQLAFYNSIKENLILASLLSDDKKEDFFLHSFSTLMFGGNEFKSYFNHYLKQDFPTTVRTERVHHLLNNDPKMNQLLLLNDTYESLILLNVIDKCALPKKLKWDYFNDIHSVLARRDIRTLLSNKASQPNRKTYKPSFGRGIQIFLSALLAIWLIIKMPSMLETQVPPSSTHQENTIQNQIATQNSINNIMPTISPVSINDFCLHENTQIYLSISSIKHEDDSVTIIVDTKDTLDFNNFYFNEVKLVSIADQVTQVSKGVEIVLDASLWDDESNELHYTISDQQIRCILKED